MSRNEFRGLLSLLLLIVILSGTLFYVRGRHSEPLSSEERERVSRFAAAVDTVEVVQRVSSAKKYGRHEKHGKSSSRRSPAGNVSSRSAKANKAAMQPRQQDAGDLPEMDKYSPK